MWAVIAEWRGYNYWCTRSSGRWTDRRNITHSCIWDKDFTLTSGAGKLYLTPPVRWCHDFPCTVFVQNCIYFLSFSASFVTTYSALRPRDEFSHPHQERMKYTYNQCWTMALNQTNKTHCFTGVSPWRSWSGGTECRSCAWTVWGPSCPSTCRRATRTSSPNSTSRSPAFSPPSLPGQGLLIFQRTVPQLSIMIIYNCTWSILIQ